MNGGGNGNGAALRWRAPFTPQQWEELEHQALIFKYFVAGVPVPPDLLLPIKRGLDAMAAARFYHHHHHHHQTLGYGSYFGKKLDPEPGRCRRTDGKKWRCAKEAAPDSKYCERHMHRGRSRSRKPVETQPSAAAAAAAPPQSQQSPSASTVTTVASAGSTAITATAFQGHPLHAIAASGNAFGLGSGSPQLQVDSFGSAPAKDLRYNYGFRASSDEHRLFLDNAGGPRVLGMDACLESSWRAMPSQTSSFALSGYSQSPIYSGYGVLNDLGTNTVRSMKPDCQAQPLFGGEFAAMDSAKHDGGQTLRPFFDEWPKARDAWPDLADENSNLALFSATQLSISIPMASSDFSTTASRSPKD